MTECGIIVENGKTVLINIDIQIIFKRKFDDAMPLLLYIIPHGKRQNSFKTVIKDGMALCGDLPHSTFNTTGTSREIGIEEKSTNILRQA